MKMNKTIIGKVKNGNYYLKTYSDGTKIRYTKDGKFKPKKPEVVNLKITNRCNLKCPMCSENSLSYGKHGNIMKLWFITNLNPYTEINITGGNPLEHPDLIPFLKRCRKHKLICNLVLHQEHFMKNIRLINRLYEEKLIHGLNISLKEADKFFVNAISKYPNAVISVIEGVITPERLKRLYNKGLKLYIHGYRFTGKGIDFYKNNSIMIDANRYMLQSALKSEDIYSKFDIVCFDNTALKNLKITDTIDNDSYSIMRINDDGKFTVYVDCVLNEYSKSPISKQKYQFIPEDSSRLFFIVNNEKYIKNEIGGN